MGTRGCRRRRGSYVLSFTLFPLHKGEGWGEGVKMKVDPKKTSFARFLRKSSTDAEQLLWYNLKNRRFLGIKFRRQQPIDSYIVDFISFERKIIIEIDGGQHNEKKKALEDQKRSNVLERKGYKVMRFWNNEVLQNLSGVLEALTLTLSQQEREQKTDDSR